MRQDERRREVVEEYVNGVGSLRELARKYGLSSSRIHRWVKEAEAAGGIDEWERQRARGELTAKRSRELPGSVKELQKELAEARLHNELLNAMIDIAEERMGVEIRKKPGAKRP